VARHLRYVLSNMPLSRSSLDVFGHSTLSLHSDCIPEWRNIGLLLWFAFEIPACCYELDGALGSAYLARIVFLFGMP